MPCRFAPALSAALWLALGASIALGAELQGVGLPATKTVDDTTLTLNGAGLRTRLFKIYVAALYVETPMSDPRQLIGSEQIKHVELHMLRNLSKEQVTEAIVGGFQRNAGAELPALEARLERLAEHVPSVKKGESLALTYVPGVGSIIRGPRIDPLTLEGADFGRAVLAIWLGPRPVEESLKRALLTGGPREVGLPARP